MNLNRGFAGYKKAEVGIGRGCLHQFSAAKAANAWIEGNRCLCLDMWHNGNQENKGKEKASRGCIKEALHGAWQNV